mmetsp:Transcript_28282/g.51047  ORF Transcript_28282/g.51047 Transcript_28282/m.51047 type:complete len:132 (-) Transcript_28282:315-710(-)
MKSLPEFDAGMYATGEDQPLQPRLQLRYALKHEHEPGILGKFRESLMLVLCQQFPRGLEADEENEFLQMVNEASIELESYAIIVTISGSAKAVKELKHAVGQLKVMGCKPQDLSSDAAGEEASNLCCALVD